MRNRTWSQWTGQRVCDSNGVAAYQRVGFHWGASRGLQLEVAWEVGGVDPHHYRKGEESGVDGAMAADQPAGGSTWSSDSREPQANVNREPQAREWQVRARLRARAGPLAPVNGSHALDRTKRRSRRGVTVRFLPPSWMVLRANDALGCLPRFQGLATVALGQFCGQPADATQRSPRLWARRQKPARHTYLWCGGTCRWYI